MLYASVQYTMFEQFERSSREQLVVTERQTPLLPVLLTPFDGTSLERCSEARKALEELLTILTFQHITTFKFA